MIQDGMQVLVFIINAIIAIGTSPGCNSVIKQVVVHEADGLLGRKSCANKK